MPMMRRLGLPLTQESIAETLCGMSSPAVLSVGIVTSSNKGVLVALASTCLRVAVGERRIYRPRPGKIAMDVPVGDEELVVASREARDQLLLKVSRARWCRHERRPQPMTTSRRCSAPVRGDCRGGARPIAAPPEPMTHHRPKEHR